MRDPTDSDVGKPVFSAGGDRIGTLRAVDYPTLYVELADDIDESLRRSMKISETTARRYDGEPLAGVPLGAVKDVTDDGVHFWTAYAVQKRHEGAAPGEAPGVESDGGSGE